MAPSRYLAVLDGLSTDIASQLGRLATTLELDLEGTNGPPGAWQLTADTLDQVAQRLDSYSLFLKVNPNILKSIGDGARGFSSASSSQGIGNPHLPTRSLCHALLKCTAFTVRWQGDLMWPPSAQPQRGPLPGTAATSAAAFCAPGSPVRTGGRPPEAQHTAARPQLTQSLRELSCTSMKTLHLLLTVGGLDLSCRIASTLLRMDTLQACSRSLAQATDRLTQVVPRAVELQDLSSDPRPSSFSGLDASGHGVAGAAGGSSMRQAAPDDPEPSLTGAQSMPAIGLTDTQAAPGATQGTGPLGPAPDFLRQGPGAAEEGGGRSRPAAAAAAAAPHAGAAIGPPADVLACLQHALEVSVVVLGSLSSFAARSREQGVSGQDAEEGGSASAVGEGGTIDESGMGSSGPSARAQHEALLKQLWEALAGSALVEHAARALLHGVAAQGSFGHDMQACLPDLLGCYTLISRLLADDEASSAAILGGPCATYLATAAGLQLLCTADGGPSYGMRSLMTDEEMRACWRVSGEEEAVLEALGEAGGGGSRPQRLNDAPLLPLLCTALRLLPLLCTAQRRTAPGTGSGASVPPGKQPSRPGPTTPSGLLCCGSGPSAAGGRPGRRGAWGRQRWRRQRWRR